MSEIRRFLSGQAAGTVQPVLQAFDVSSLSGAETQHTIRSLGEHI